jgi:hypothetical protein
MPTRKDFNIIEERRGEIINWQGNLNMIKGRYVKKITHRCPLGALRPLLPPMIYLKEERLKLGSE